MTSGNKLARSESAQKDILDHLNVSQARAVVITLPDHRTSLHVIRQVQSQAPEVTIIARSRYHAYAEELKSAGAAVVLDEEEEMGRVLKRAAAEHLNIPVEKDEVEP